MISADQRGQTRYDESNREVCVCKKCFEKERDIDGLILYDDWHTVDYRSSYYSALKKIRELNKAIDK